MIQVLLSTTAGRLLTTTATTYNKAVLSQLCSRRTFVSPTRPLAADYPYHLVVGLPALSPTMESGVLAEWYVDTGASFSAGDAICKIETDKASIDFEAQDDGFIAKLLMDAGNGNDIPVGTPIFISVEDPDHVSVFEQYVVAAPAAPAAVPPPVAAAPKPTPPPPAAAQPAPAPAAPTTVATTPPPPPLAVTAAAVTGAPAASVKWGLGAQSASPLAKTLTAKQVAYIGKYGSTGQLPL